jgi:hypothetical protein
MGIKNRQDQAIEILIDHFLAERRKTSEELTVALEQIYNERKLEEFGRAIWRQMIELHVAHLLAERSILTAKLPRRRFH